MSVIIALWIFDDTVTVKLTSFPLAIIHCKQMYQSMEDSIQIVSSEGRAVKKFLTHTTEFIYSIL